MKTLRLAVLLALAAPGAARAADATIVSHDLPVGGARTFAAVQAPVRFDLVGFHWQGRGTVSFRSRGLNGRWRAWRAVDVDDHVSPEVEGRSPRGWRLGEPYWTGPADRIEYRPSGAIRRLKAYFVWSPVEAVPARSLSLAGSPQIVMRSGWAADDAIRRAPPRYAASVRFAVVHHTAGTNDYGPLQSAAIVRGIELYHVKGNGWNDIGYNFLVDRFGQIFEGRYGGITRNVIGAHAEGFNRGSVGVAVIGNYSKRGISPAAQAALVKLLAWRLDIAHVDPLTTLIWISGGNPRFPADVPVFLRAISGHRDTGFTDCPGDALYRQLPAITAQVAATGLPKLYAPSVQGRLGGAVTFQARLSATERWTVSVRDATGKVVASGSGTGTAVAWTWLSAGVPPGRYTWTIDAGPFVRPASGTSGAAPLPPPPPTIPLLAAFSVTPSFISPNGDGVADAATIAYTLGERALVTATVTDETGAVVATLFADQRQSARRISFPSGADGIPDGRYTVTISARSDDGRTAQAEAPLLVDRTLSSLAASPPSFSPNGDGQDDTIAFTFSLAAAAQVTVEVVQNGQPVATAFSGQLQPGLQQVTWDGSTPSGTIPDGHYDVLVTVTDELAEISESIGFDVSTVPG